MTSELQSSPKVGVERHIVTAAAGDTNLKYAERKALAEAGGATLVEGHGVDCLFLIGAKCVETHVLAKGGSDHPPVIHILNAQGRRIVIGQWNVYVGQRPSRVRRRLRRLIKDWQPDVIMLSEAYRCRDQLAKISGYHLTQGANVGEGADCALLTRLDHHLIRSGTKRMTKTWRGPLHDHPTKAPREFQRGRSRVAPGLVLRSLSLHLPTSDKAGHNAPAVDEAVGFLTRYLRRG